MSLHWQHINSVTFGGRFTKDPELRTFNEDRHLCEFTLCNNKRRKKGEAPDKDDKRDAHFIDCVAYGGTARMICQYFKKGRRIIIEGQINQERWMDKTTQSPRSRIKIAVNDFHFVDIPTGDDASTSAREYEEDQQPAKVLSKTTSKVANYDYRLDNYSVGDDDDDDLPLP